VGDVEIVPEILATEIMLIRQ